MNDICGCEANKMFLLVNNAIETFWELMASSCCINRKLYWNFFTLSIREKLLTFNKTDTKQHKIPHIFTPLTQTEAKYPLIILLFLIINLKKTESVLVPRRKGYLGYGNNSVGHTSPNIGTQHHRDHPENIIWLFNCLGFWYIEELGDQCKVVFA